MHCNPMVHDQATIPTVARALGAAAPVAQIAQGQHKEKLPLIKKKGQNHKLKNRITFQANPSKVKAYSNTGNRHDMFHVSGF